MTTKRQPVNLQKGQTVTINAGLGCVLEVTRYASGAVELRNAKSGVLLREWGPQEAKQR